MTTAEIFFSACKRRRERMLRKLANMRAAKERKRQERIAAGLVDDPEPKMEFLRHPHLSWAMRDDLSGEVVWMEFKSVRDLTRRASMVARHYQPGRFKI